MITIAGLAKSHGAQVLFRGVGLQLSPGRRYGLVGANGSGKSTLLRIIAGEMEPSEGSVSLPRRARVGTLGQDHFRYEETPIIDVVMMGHSELWEAMQDKERMLEAPPDQFDADRFGELEEIVQRHDGYSLEARAAEILAGLNIPGDVHKEPLSVLSGGYKLRALLGQVLAGNPDVLLLDEPTNHLDILSIRWLEKFLCGFKGCAVLVSHDHRFLNNVCTDILDVDYETITRYKGNYSDFERAKREDRERREAEIAQREKEIADRQATIARFKAKPTKARQSQSMARLVERIVIEDLPRSSRRYPVFDLKARRRSGKVAVEAAGISKAYGENVVLRDVGLTVRRGDRLAIIGPNGIGKSTLLKILVGSVEPDAGSVEWGHEADPGYFAQDHGELHENGDMTVQDWFWRHCPGEQIGFVRSKLGQVLFDTDDVAKPISALSGGETARLVLARLGVLKPTVLVLDEPTNHLDLEGIESLVKGLKRYDGTILFVSHDRWFVSRLANRVLEITPRGIEDFRGTYVEYLEHCGDDHLDVEAALLRKRRARRAAKRDA